MALDPRYILLPPLQNIFRDKDTGLPLRNGYLLFFGDNQRTVGKEVFQLTGSPPNYSYIPLGILNLDGSWQVTLDQNGSISNGTNTTNLYWFPYDSMGNVQLYFVQVYSSGGILQYSLEAEPNFIASGSNTSNVNENFVPNGQFLWHTDLPAVPPSIPFGRVQKPITQIAYGGWTFERPTGSGAQDNVTFDRYGSWSATPEADPRYACRVSCTLSDSGNVFKDLRLRFDNVNRFSSDTLYYTYGFSAVSNTGSSVTVEVLLIKNFGTGGSATTETSLGNIVVTNSLGVYFVSFIPGDNLGQTIGTKNDDFIQLAIRFPVADIFDASFTDVLFTAGQYTLSMPPLFPQQTNSQTAYRAVAGFLDLANYDSQDLYLPIMLSPTGLTYDTSVVGKVYASSNIGVSIGEIYADGSSFKVNAFSSDGIPYSRLFSKYFDQTKLMPTYGTGLSFVSTYFTNIDTFTDHNSLRIQNNAIGTATDFSDGGTPTGFTFSKITPGTDPFLSTNCFGLYYGLNNFYILCKAIGSLNDNGISAGTTSFSVSIVRLTNPSVSTSAVKSIYSVSTVGGSSITGGQYFAFNNTTGAIAVWYKVDGVGTQPSVPGVSLYIEIDIKSTWDSNEISRITSAAISGSKLTNVITVAGSSVTAGSYWNLNTASQEYYVWYKVNGSGTDPMPSGKIGIEVDILNTDTDQQVATKTLTSLNSTYFAIPDLRGMFLRGVDNSGTIDTDNALRWTFYNQMISNEQGDLTGSFQFDEITQHTHPVVIDTVGALGFTGGLETDGSPPSPFGGIPYSGGSESRPLNANINWVIRY